MRNLPMVRIFAPEIWGELEKFSKFYQGTYDFDITGQKAVSGAVNHFSKAQVFVKLAIKLIPNIHADQKELETNGFTPANNSQEISAVIEEVFTELYSSVDCARQIVYKIFKKCRGLPDSTRKMFVKLRTENKIIDFPEELSNAFKAAIWFDRLCTIRDELTHLSIGSCHFNNETSTITYMHHGIKIKGKSLIIDDVINYIESLFNDVNAFLGQVFHYLNSCLKDERMSQLCGIFFGRGYLRSVSPKSPNEFNSGICESYKWFEKTTEFICPFSKSCGAYIAAKG